MIVFPSLLSCSSDLLLGEPQAVALTISAGGSTTISVGEEVALSAVAQQRNGRTMQGAPVLWTSSDTRVATVNASTGRLRGIATGSAQVQAAFAGASSTLLVQVRVPVATVLVNPSTLTLTVGQSVQMSAVLRDGAGNVLTGRSIAWSASDAGVASVSNAGVVSALSTSGAPSRTITIFASSEGRQGTATVVVLR